MFRIGEFSKIAQISIRMLRHYDEIGLLKPAYTDTFTSYRYYTAEQLADVNRIVALKELGLTLEQIARLLHSHVSQDELRGMLMLKKAQTEQAIQDEIARLKEIESRIHQMDHSGELSDIAVVLKSVPDQRFLAIRQTLVALEDSYALMDEMQRLLTSSQLSKTLGHFVAISHDDFFDTENMDVEFGFVLQDDLFDESVTLTDGQAMTVRELPPVEKMLSVTHIGSAEAGHRRCFNAMGLWLARHGGHFAGPGREIIIQFPTLETEAVIEIQFPVEITQGDRLMSGA